MISFWVSPRGSQEKGKCKYASLPVEIKTDKILNHEGHEGHKVFLGLSIFTQIRLVNLFSMKIQVKNTKVEKLKL